ncbi:hypothetical protein ACFSKN_09970 [Mariniflexile gromovii]|uniref:ZU5 domain-containing protein n=1 Tax=Mariniflexile gromovii TaxID=362523 RepID=A0ABS4BXZ1_9FLAO|nr:hypothetical protein [Mariniflexile gromovii]MBP0905439.1 hypothetical protein [Mariniflexile gromovii]
MKTYKINILVLLTLLTVAFISCEDEGVKNDDNGNPSGPVVGKVTEIGVPLGEVETTIIGPSGGSFSTSDNRLRIDVPAGAFTSDQTLTVQPITNNNGPGKGLAYRLSPHSLTFSKPIKLTFSYTDEETSTTFAEALAIAYQDKYKVWQAIGISELDLINKTVSVYTTHFSDWSLFESFHIIPATSTVSLGETIELKVVGYFGEDLLVPLVAGEQAPITEPREASQYVKKWTLAGSGVLKSTGAKATYTAPNQVPTVNPVAVTAEVDLKHKGKYFLVRNLYIGQTGIYLKLDNNDFFHMEGEVRYIQDADLSMLTGGTILNGETRGIAIHWQGKISKQTFQWTSEFPLFNYNYQSRYMYLQYYYQEVSPGSLIITGYGDVGEYVTGTFYLEASGLLDSQVPAGGNPWPRKGKIEGFFKVRRSI